MQGWLKAFLRLGEPFLKRCEIVPTRNGKLDKEKEVQYHSCLGL
jgi:hypothetical protein